MKLYELLELPVEELNAHLRNTSEELANLRFQKATHQLANPLLIRERRREIAQIKTLLKEYESGKRTKKQTMQPSEKNKE